MATTLTYTTAPISTRVDPRGRYYGKIEAAQLTAEESLRDIMAYKKINAFSESTVLMLLNDLLQGAVELTALDGKTRVLGQMLRVYMALEGSFPVPTLSIEDKSALKVRTQLLKDLKYPVDPSNFTLTQKGAGTAQVTGVHYSGQATMNEDAVKFGAQTIVVGKNFLTIDWSETALDLYNPTTDSSIPWTNIGTQTFEPSENALLLAPLTNQSTVFPGDGPWDAILGAYDQTTNHYYFERNVKVYPATGE